MDALSERGNSASLYELLMVRRLMPIPPPYSVKGPPLKRTANSGPCPAGTGSDSGSQPPQPQPVFDGSRMGKTKSLVLSSYVKVAQALPSREGSKSHSQAN